MDAKLSPIDRHADRGAMPYHFFQQIFGRTNTPSCPVRKAGGLFGGQMNDNATWSEDRAFATELFGFSTIDEFGTGNSSLGSLKRFPLDMLKIDRSFVIGIDSDAEDVAIVTAIINLAHSLGLETIADGVERKEQLDTLRELGCETGQGFYFARPRPSEASAALRGSREPIAPPVSM